MSSFTQDNGYERKTTTNGGPSIEDRWHGLLADVWDQKEFIPGMTCDYDKSLALSKITLSKDVSGSRGYIDLLYTPFDATNPPVDSGKNMWTLTNGTLEKALETHPNYKKCWNNYLVMASGKTTPAWWETDGNDASLPDPSQFQWVKDLGSVDTQSIGLMKNCTVLNKKKPGVETYILPCPVVEATLYYSQAAKANTIAKNVGKRLSPASKFGIVGGEWLVMESTVILQGKKYVATVRYQWADVWDHDIYTG
jgi:hypothetical protein